MTPSSTSYVWSDEALGYPSANDYSVSWVEASPPARAASPSWVRDFETIAAYEDDWDGMGAIAPTPELLRTTSALLISLTARDLGAPERLVASPTGSVVVEWNFRGSYFEVEIEEPGLAEWMLESPDGSYQHGVFDLGGASVFTPSGSTAGASEPRRVEAPELARNTILVAA